MSNESLITDYGSPITHNRLRITDYPKVAIIILNWNGWEDTIECLESLKKITYPNYEVIVVDNGSEGNDADILEEKYGDYIKVIRNKENLGFTGGNNVAIYHVLQSKNPPDYVFLLNNDAKIEPDCLNVCVRVAQLTKAGIVGARIRNPKNGSFFTGSTSLFYEFFGKISSIFPHSPSTSSPFWEVARVHGAGMLIWRKLLEKVRKEHGYYLRPDYFCYWEETEFCHYAREKAYKVVMARDAIMNHEDKTALNKNSPLVFYYFTRNRIFLANETLPFYLKILFHLLNIPTRFLRAIQKTLKGQPKVSIAILQGLFDGYKNVRGKWKYHKG